MHQNPENLFEGQKRDNHVGSAIDGDGSSINQRDHKGERRMEQEVRMTGTLPSCPFCGYDGTSLEIIFNDGDQWMNLDGDEWTMAFSVECNNCHCRTPYFTDSDEAIATWSRRAGHQGAGGAHEG